MSFTDQRAHAVGRCQSAGRETAQQGHQLGVQAGKEIDEENRRHRREAGCTT